MSGCRAFLPLLDAVVDGELGEVAPDRVLEVEQHLDECETCASRVRLAEATRASLRRAVRAESEPSDAMKQRILGALLAERALEASNLESARRARMLAWRTIVPVAAAAGFTLVWAASMGDVAHAPRVSSSAVVAGGIAATAEELIEDLVEHHAAPSAPEVVEPDLVQRFEPAVGVPVQLPSLQQFGARWEGGSIVPIRQQRAASFQYRVAGHRVTVYVYDSSRVPLRGQLEPRVVRNMAVFVGQRRGYSIAAVEERGVGHALASDLDSAETAELVASAVLH